MNKYIRVFTVFIVICISAVFCKAALEAKSTRNQKVGYGNTFYRYACKYTLTGKTKNCSYTRTPVGEHGALSVKGTQLVDQKREPYILRGVSTHGVHWNNYGEYVNKTALQNLRDEWGVNLIRIVSYVKQGGYTEGSQAKIDETIRRGVASATELGMYVIIDWHILDENPNDSIKEAKAFFEKYAKLYADHNNVIFEICNEPTNTSWPALKKYASRIVAVIRKYHSNALIIAGTNNWSQDVDEVAKNGGKLKDGNVMYAFHFYAGTHRAAYRKKVVTALKAGTPVFCSEFGICNSSGNCGIDLKESDRWIRFLEKNQISYCCFSLSNKNESVSMLSPLSKKVNGWKNKDLGVTGAWLINIYRSRNEK